MKPAIDASNNKESSPMSITAVATALRRPHVNETLEHFVGRMLSRAVIGVELGGDETTRAHTRIGERNQIAAAIVERYPGSSAADALAAMVRDPDQDAATIRQTAHALIRAEGIEVVAGNPAAALPAPSTLGSIRSQLARVTHGEDYGINAMIAHLDTLIDESGSATWTREQRMSYLRAHPVDATWVGMLRSCDNADDAQTLVREVFTSRDYPRALDYSIWRTLFALHMRDGNEAEAATIGARLLRMINERTAPHILGTVDRTRAVLSVPREDAYVRQALTALRVGADMVADPWLAQHTFAPEMTPAEQEAALQAALREARRAARAPR